MNNQDKEEIGHVIPRYGWSRSIQDELIPQLKPFTVPWRDIWYFAGLGFRFFTGYYFKHKIIQGKLPTFDPFVHNICPAEQKGPPLGGIGSGVITRSWQGDFTRWGLKCGQYHNKIVHADQFSLFVQQENMQHGAAIVLNHSNQDQESNQLSQCWNWWRTNREPAFNDLTGTFTSLFPCSYNHYKCPSQNIELVCKQFSPVIGHNYKESSFPVTCFKWIVKNLSSTSSVKVSLMFTFQNGVGEDSDVSGAHWNQVFSNGVNMVHKLQYTKAQVEKNENITDSLTFSIAGNKNVSVFSEFFPSDPYSSTHLWQKFARDGSLLPVNIDNTVYHATKCHTLGSAVCIELVIPAGGTDEAVFTFAWDLPITRFGQSSFYKKYTQYYPPTTGPIPVAQQIAMDAQTNYRLWEQMIDQWQQPVLTDPSLPDWYKSALFHELYYIVDGGTVWTNGGPIQEDGTFNTNEEHFSYLEGHEYIMFTTYDVHFYASFALIMNWPQIQLTIQRDYIRSIYYEHDEEYKWCGSGKVSKRKLKGCVPHDLGTTAEDPFFKVNSYQIQDTNRWKDLNCMFVLLVYRDYHVTKDEKYLREAYPAVIEVINYHLHNFDKDGDGLIENEGFPDSTYDTWVCTGPSAFCGGLWISALFCAHKMASILGDAANEQKFLSICNQATAAYEQKLWNPNGYYNYDANANQDRAYMSDTVMSDQLCGHTFLRACQLPSLLKPERVSSALQKIYKLNVLKYQEITGNAGAVNGMRPTGEIDTSLMQCKEVWTGTSYLLASSMLHEGMREEALNTARGVYETCMRLGYWFQTPEAYHETGAYRSLGYMRPLSIWSIQLAHQQHQQQQ